jgi:hypothetical protein
VIFVEFDRISQVNTGGREEIPGEYRRYSPQILASHLVPAS